MPGSTHSTRHPHKLSEIVSRDELGLVARSRVKNADLRKVVYSKPLGKGFHKVTNPGGGQEYVVADGLGGATLQKGATAVAASFSGQHGEVLISRPPAGLGSSTAVITSYTVSAPTGGGEEVVYNYERIEYVDLCYSDDDDAAYLLAIESSTDAVPQRFRLALIKVEYADLPHDTTDVEEIVGEIFTGYSGSFVRSFGMHYIGGDQIIVYYIGAAESPSADFGVYINKISTTGEVSASVNYDVTGDFDVAGPSGTISLEQSRVNLIANLGYIFAIEPVTTLQQNYPVKPGYNNRRLVKRSVTDLSESNESSFSNQTGTTGHLRFYTLYASLSKNKVFSQYLDEAFDAKSEATAYSSDASLGSVATSSGSETFGHAYDHDRYMYGADKIMRTYAAINNRIITWDMDVTSDSGYSIIYDGVIDFGSGIFDRVSDSEAVILGDGGSWVTSLVNSGGQHTP